MKDFSKAQKWLRRLVISYNIFFWVTGPGIVGLGIWFYIVLSKYEPVVIRKDFAGPAYIIIVGGATSVIAGIVGCLGGVNEHRRLLLAYFSLMSIVCILEVSATVYTFLEYDDIEETLRTSLMNSIIDFQGSGKDDMIEDVQTEFSCCGINGPSDWLTQRMMNGSDSSTTVLVPMTTLPTSCCKNISLTEECLEDVAFTQGCLPDLMHWVQMLLVITGWTIFTMACTQLLALAVICCLTKAVTFIYF